MTSSYTLSGSFTITDARYVGAKIGADLRLLNAIYGQPALVDIDDYAEEVALLLRDGHLGTVDYGFKNGDAWTLRLRYTATAGGQLADSRPGSLPPAVQIANSAFFSYLTYSQKFNGLSAGGRSAVKAALPVNRTGAPEPTVGAGNNTYGHGYARNSAGVARDVYTSY